MTKSDNTNDSKTADQQPIKRMVKKVETKEDGRTLIYYNFESNSDSSSNLSSVTRAQAGAAQANAAQAKEEPRKNV